MRIVHWFRRDLRLRDNPALAWAAANASELVLLYVHAPQDEAPWSPGAASRWWLEQSLSQLAAELEDRGQRLVLRRGTAGEILPQLIEQAGAQALSYNRLYEPAALARDQRISKLLERQGVAVHADNAQLLVEPWDIATGQGRPYRVFTPFWKQALTRLPSASLGEIPVLPGPGHDAGGPALAELGVAPRHRWTQKLTHHWQPGEAGALSRADAFAAESYARLRDRPDEPATSRLSPHLHWGEISPRRLLALGGPLDADNRFLTELGWREFAHHLLYHFPYCTDRPLNPQYRDFPWRSPEEAAQDLGRWQRGETGIDLVDAGMRELWATGWMHNRVRMLVASLLTKNLGIHWLAGARWFWDTLVDADLASNTLGWQWVAGCGADAAPYFRIFNPDTQAQKFDPDGRYRQRWLDGARPAPIVDLKRSRAAALQRHAHWKRRH